MRRIAPTTSPSIAKALGKVVYHYFPTSVSDGSHYQLFNLAEDPFEQTNLAGSRPDELCRLMQGLIAGLVHCDAVYPIAGRRNFGAVKPKLP